MKPTSLYLLTVTLSWLVAPLPARGAAPPAPAPAPELGPSELSRDSAVRWALQHNPELMALRQQHGIAAAGVVIANTYPFNPVWEGKIRAAFGPESAGVTNNVSNEHKVLMDVEIRHQGRYRRQAAGAALSRADWDIVALETALAVRTARAFDAVVYRYQKKGLIQETIDLNQKAAKEVALLVEKNKLRPADAIIIGAEVDDARTQLSGGNLALAAAWADLRRTLGLVDEKFDLQGDLDLPKQPEPAEALTQAALEGRADLHSRRAAIEEADARLRLEIANRYGNANVGPAFEYDPTRVNLVGVQITMPLAVFNTRQGEIQQRRAERDRAGLEMRQTEVLIRQDVHAALTRLDRAREGVRVYQKEVRPNLETALKKIRQLFDLDPNNVDLLKVIDVQRKLLRARDAEFDALWELRQAQADLAAAIGDPALVAAP